MSSATPAPPVTRGSDPLRAWALAYVRSTDLAHKLAPPDAPSAGAPSSHAVRLERPGRPACLAVVPRTRRVFRGSLRSQQARARLFHTFLHHELQAAELMCWAILAFPDTPTAFRDGLARIALDEVRHMNLYVAELDRLGSAVGAFPVRDWFWERVPAVRSPLAFVSVLGMGFEGANLDHCQRFSRLLADAGDRQAAEVQERVGREEVAHVRFAAQWFMRWTGRVDFPRWVQELPAPLSPMVMRGDPIAVESRARAGLDRAFVDALSAFEPG